MNVIVEYWSRTISGMEQFFVTDKMAVLLLAAFFLLGLQDRKLVSEKGNRLMFFSLVASIILLCPVTAVVGVIYQTAFYDYEWLWSMVPITIVLSYVAVLLYDTKVENSSWKKKVPLVAAFLFLLFWCGNQGMLKTVDTEAVTGQDKASRIIEVLKEDVAGDRIMLWAPQNIMQEARRQTGMVQLIYGRDMWEPKAGAYDYETYSDTLIAAYEWIQELDGFITEDEVIYRVLKIQWEEQRMDIRLQEILPTLLQEGVNTIVIPAETMALFEETYLPIAKEYGLEAEVLQTEEYLLYRLKK